MKSKSKSWHIGKFLVSVGIGPQIALSIYINSIFMGIDIGCFYISLEY